MQSRCIGNIKQLLTIHPEELQGKGENLSESAEWEKKHGKSAANSLASEMQDFSDLKQGVT